MSGLAVGSYNVFLEATVCPSRSSMLVVNLKTFTIGLLGPLLKFKITQLVNAQNTSSRSFSKSSILGIYSVSISINLSKMWHPPSCSESPCSAYWFRLWRIFAYLATVRMTPLPAAAQRKIWPSLLIYWHALPPPLIYQHRINWTWTVLLMSDSENPQDSSASMNQKKMSHKPKKLLIDRASSKGKLQHQHWHRNSSILQWFLPRKLPSTEQWSKIYATLIVLFG